MKDPHTENYKTLIKEIKENINYWKNNQKKKKQRKCSLTLIVHWQWFWGSNTESERNKKKISGTTSILRASAQQKKQ